MRVLHVINDLRVGGAETLFADLVPAQRILGIAAEAAVLAPSGLFVEQLLRETGAPLHVGPYAIRDPRNVVWLRKLASGFDLVHVQLWPAQLWCAMAALEKPVVATEQNTLNRRRNYPVLRALDGWMYSRFSHTIAVSREAERSLLEWTPSIVGKTSVIFNGLPLERYSRATPTALELPRPLLVCCARLEPQKDLPTLLEALALLPECGLVIAGEGPLRPVLEARVAQLGLSARVVLPGRIADVPGLLAAADLYVQPSRYEGFPRATAEAMAAGLPIVVSDGPGFTDLVGDAALRFPVGDARALAATATDALAKSGALRVASRSRAARFSIEACAEEHIRLYEMLIAPHAI